MSDGCWHLTPSSPKQFCHLWLSAHSRPKLDSPLPSPNDVAQFSLHFFIGPRVFDQKKQLVQELNDSNFILEEEFILSMWYLIFFFNFHSYNFCFQFHLLYFYFFPHRLRVCQLMTKGWNNTFNRMKLKKTEYCIVKDEFLF